MIRTPRRLRVAGARNYGAASANGEVLVFCDAHIEVDTRWVPLLAEVIRDPRVGLAGPTVCGFSESFLCGYGMVPDEGLNVHWLPRVDKDPYPVPMICGAFVAIRRQLSMECGGFDAGLLQWGLEDLELSMHIWAAGYQCMLIPRIVVRFLFRTRQPYRVAAGKILHNVFRVGTVHFGEHRLTRLRNSRSSDPAATEAEQLLLAGDAKTRQHMIRAHRIHDDDWYFETICANRRPIRHCGRRPGGATQ